MRVHTLALAALLLSSACAAAADWSFDASPIPHIDDLTAAELRQLDTAGAVGAGIATVCAAQAAAHLTFYTSRYPAFAALGEVGISDWRRAAFALAIPGLSDCVLHVPATKARALLPALGPELLFCGQPARPAGDEAEEAFLAAVDEMLAYADAGHPVAVVNLLSLNGIVPAVALSDDLEYFLRRSLARDRFEHPAEWDVSHLTSLSPEQRRTLDGAVDAYDLHAAIAGATTCRPAKAEGRP